MKRHDDEIILILILLVLTFKIKSQIISRIKFFHPSHFMRTREQSNRTEIIIFLKILGWLSRLQKHAREVSDSVKSL